MQILKFVITGGPCGGKSSAMERIRSEFTERGYAVLIIPETATELINGGVAPWTCRTNVDYQICQMKLQLYKEQIFEEAARTMTQEKILIFCDRGALDNKAYMTEESFASVLQLIGCTEVSLSDEYAAVFHLVTAAKGAEAFYTTANNSARTETVAEASALDDRVLAAWSAHPHHVIVDNSTDFSGKLDRLVAAIDAYLSEAEV